MKLRIPALMVLALTLLSSCANDYKKLAFNSCSIDSVGEIGLSGGRMSTTLNLGVNVSNPSSSKFEISELNAVVYSKNGTEFATLSAPEPITLLPKSEGEVRVPISVAVNDPMALLIGGGLDFTDKKADISLKAKQNGIGPKSLEWRQIPVDSLMQALKIKMK